MYGICRNEDPKSAGISDLYFVLAFHFSPLWTNGAALRSMNSIDAILVAFSAVRRYEKMSQHPFRYWMRCDDTGRLVTWEFPLRIDSAS